jgi:glycosyltransferase involved in cell wall biosynthesis
MEAPNARRAARAGGTPPPRVAYIMSRFPKLTETFILYEILALESQGTGVAVYPLLREKAEVAHPEVEAVMPRVRFHPFLSLPILRAHLHYLVRKPATYVLLLAEILRGTFRSRNFLVGALGIYPKAVRFAYEMSAAGIEHVHAHFATHPAVAALIIHRLTGIPFSFTAHGSDLHVDRRMLDRKVDAAAFVVTVSEYNKNVITNECGEHVREKVEVVHCGVDPQVFTPRERERPDGSIEILCVASYEEVKGHRYLVEACAKLAGRGVDFRCHLVGEGPLRAEVEDQIRKSGLTERVVVHGGLPRDKVIALLSQVDVVTLPSVLTKQGKKEGIPVALMEGMASGLPVVSSRLSGIPELVEDGVSGILAEPRDAEGLAAALETLAKDPGLRARLGAAGREKVLRDFNLRRNALALADLFRRSSDQRLVEEIAALTR